MKLIAVVGNARGPTTTDELTVDLIPGDTCPVDGDERPALRIRQAAGLALVVDLSNVRSWWTL